MRTTAKIRKRKIKDGHSFALSIIHNYRNPMSGTPTNRTVAYFGSVRDSEINKVAESWWKETDDKIDELTKENQIWVNDAETIKRKFESVVPRPSATVLKVTSESSIDDIRVALSERGIKL